MSEIPGTVYLVGGAVRDQLLGLPIMERDWVVVGSSTAAMQDAGFHQVGKDFPVFLHPETKEEYALARTERKTNLGHLGFETEATEFVTLEEDLARRDLTINAIAQDQEGNLIDPYGGLEDLSNKTLKHVTRAFVEDPLRVLRTARFAASFHTLGFSVASETLNLMQELSLSGELEALSPERIWRETEKALVSVKPRVFFETLRECHALSNVFPEVDALFGIEQRPDYHPEIDAGLHTMLALDQITAQTDSSVMRFATLTHDLGKATTPKEFLPGHPEHETRGADLVANLCTRMRIPNRFKKLAIRVARYHLQCHRALELRPKTVEKLLSNIDAWRSEESLLGFVNCCMADARGRTGLEHRPYPQFEFLIECVQAGKLCNVNALREKGFEGERLGEAIREERISAITKTKTRYSHIDERQYTKANPA